MTIEELIRLLTVVKYVSIALLIVSTILTVVVITHIVKDMMKDRYDKMRAKALRQREADARRHAEHDQFFKIVEELR